LRPALPGEECDGADPPAISRFRHHAEGFAAAAARIVDDIVSMRAGGSARTRRWSWCCAFLPLKARPCALDRHCAGRSVPRRSAPGAAHSPLFWSAVRRYRAHADGGGVRGILLEFIELLWRDLPRGDRKRRPRTMGGGALNRARHIAHARLGSLAAGGAQRPA